MTDFDSVGNRTILPDIRNSVSPVFLPLDSNAPIAKRAAASLPDPALARGINF